MRVVKAFGQEERELDRMVAVVPAAVRRRMRAIRLQARYQPLLEAIPTLAQVAVLALGGWLVLQGDITLGTFLAFSTYVAQFVAPARQLAGVLTIGQQARAGVERIFQLLDLEPGDRRRPRRGRAARAARRDRASRRALRLRRRQARCCAGSTSTSPPANGSPSSGRAAAASRRSSALVPRFYDPDRGQVLVDGHDVRGVTLHSLRRQIGVAFEESFLFSDTIAANIAYGRPDATDEEIEAAAGVAERRRLHPRAAPTATTPWSASAGSPSPVASASGSRWPGRC